MTNVIPKSILCVIQLPFDLIKQSSKSEQYAAIGFPYETPTIVFDPAFVLAHHLMRLLSQKPSKHMLMIVSFSLIPLKI
jgi:hypothetical protein